MVDEEGAAGVEGAVQGNDGPDPPGDEGAPADARSPTGDVSHSASLDTADELLKTEERLGTSAGGYAINGMLRALSKAARSILLYDPGNEAVRTFIKDYRSEARKALEYGRLDLGIRPFEIVHGDEVVYLERDRERSLAFRMFRDGVRRLRIEPSVLWDELFQLLEILSIRYVGVRQTEDDIVTLLWKAGFQNISIVAVEGFVPEEEADGEGVYTDDYDPSMVGLRQASVRVDVPPDWDLPLLPHETASEALAYRPVGGTDLQRMRDEVDSVRLAELCVRLVDEMLELVSDPADPTELADLYHFFAEVRDFFLAEGQIGSLVDLAKHLANLGEAATPRLRYQLGKLADRAALTRILRSASRVSDEPPDELLELLELVPGDHLASLVDILAIERSGAARRVARRLIQRYVHARLEYLRSQLLDAEPRVAADLLNAIGSVDVKLGLAVAALVCDRDEHDVQTQILGVVERCDGKEVGAKALLDMLVSPDPRVRIQLADKIGDTEDRRAFRPLVDRLTGDTGRHMELLEAEAIGVALARLHPRRAMDELLPWVRPPGWLQRFTYRNAQPSVKTWAGVAGLALLRQDDARDALRWLADTAGDDLRAHCRRALRQRRKDGIDDD